MADPENNDCVRMSEVPDADDHDRYAACATQMGVPALRPHRSRPGRNQLAAAWLAEALKNIADNCFSNAEACSNSSPSRAHNSASIAGSSGR